MTLRSPRRSAPPPSSRGGRRRTGPSSNCAASRLLLHALPPAAAAAAAADDHLVGLLALLAGATLGLAPRRHRMATARALALTTAEGVVDRVHGHAADVRALALPPVAAGLAHLHQRCLGVADRADRGAAVDGHAAHLAGREPQRRELTFLRHGLDCR